MLFRSIDNLGPKQQENISNNEPNIDLHSKRVSPALPLYICRHCNGYRTTDEREYESHLETNHLGK